MKQVTLIGRGPSWKECPPETDELWGTATCLIAEGLKDKNFTKVFTFDRNVYNGEHDIAKERNIPIVSDRGFATEPFDKIAIVKALRSSYFMPTMSYMIAYAIYLEYERISLYGIDTGPQWWYQFGKPYITFWLGQAIARGISVRMGVGSLQWSMQPGLDKLPRAWLKEEYEKFYPGKFNKIRIQP